MGYGLIAAVMWGLSAVAAAKAARRTGTYLAVLCGQGVGVLSLLVLATAVRPSFAAVDGAVALHLTGAGLVGLLGYLCYYRAIEDGPVGLGSAISSTYGGIAALLAVIVLGERLGVIGIAGVVLAVAGVAMAIARATGQPGSSADPSALAPGPGARVPEASEPAGPPDPPPPDAQPPDATPPDAMQPGLGVGEPIVGVAPVPGRPRRLSRLAIPLAFASALAYGPAASCSATIPAARAGSARH